MLQNIFNKNKSSETQFLEIDPFWTFNSFYQVCYFNVNQGSWDETVGGWGSKSNHWTRTENLR